jgi:hypothetical protein
MNTGSPPPPAKPPWLTGGWAAAFRTAKPVAVVLWFFVALGDMLFSKPVTAPTGWQIVLSLAITASWCAAAYWMLDFLIGRMRAGGDEATQPALPGSARYDMPLRGLATIVTWMFLIVVMPAIFMSHSGSDPAAGGWWWIGVLLVPLGWLAAGVWIYDSVFTMAEARWAGATRLRKVFDPLLRSLFRHHAPP